MASSEKVVTNLTPETTTHSQNEGTTATQSHHAFSDCDDASKDDIDNNLAVPCWPSHVTKKYTVILLDPNAKDHESDYENMAVQLQYTVNSIQRFTDVDQCVDFLTEAVATTLFLVTSASVAQTVVPFVHDVPRLDSIYIFDDDEMSDEQWKKEWKKIEGIAGDMSYICDQLKRKLKQCEPDLIATNIASRSSTSDGNELDQSFMYSQLLKETLLEMKDDERTKKTFFQFYHSHHANNQILEYKIDRFQHEFDDYSPIWWYNTEPSVSIILNTALATQDIGSIIKLGFYIRALHGQIERVHAATQHMEPMTVYRGKVVSNDILQKMTENLGRLISFNSFLATTNSSDVASCYADLTQENSESKGIIFQIEIDPCVSTTPYAILDDSDRFHCVGKEVLFSMHSVFRIKATEQLTDNLWAVTLTLTSETDQDLNKLTACIRDEIQGNSQLHRLGNLLVKMGEFQKAEEAFRTLLTTTLRDNAEQDVSIFIQFGNILQKMGNLADALDYFQRALNIQIHLIPLNYANLARVHNYIGEVYLSMHKKVDALSNYEQALEMQKQHLPSEHPDLATTYNHLGQIRFSMGEYSGALADYKMTLDIQQKSLPTNHPSLAATYGDVAAVYQSIGDYSTALSHFEKALEIRQKSLPSTHPDLGTAFQKIGEVNHSLGDYEAALSYHNKALDVQQTSLPSNHLDLATTYKNIGRTQSSRGEYSLSLTFYDKALGIQQRSLPSNHPDLASTYQHIGRAHFLMGAFSPALSFHGRALHIQQDSVLPNAPEVATSYNNVGEVYYSMGEYAQANSYFQKALEIHRNTLQYRHPDLSVTYSNMGRVHIASGELKTALTFCKKAMKHQILTLPSNHPSLATTFNSIASVYKQMEHYADALYYYEKALKVESKIYAPNHASLLTTRKRIAKMYLSTGDYDSALRHYTQVLELLQMEPIDTNLHLIAEIYYTIATDLENRREYNKALDQIQRAIAITHQSQQFENFHLKKYEEYFQQLSLRTHGTELVNAKQIDKYVCVAPVD